MDMPYSALHDKSMTVTKVYYKHRNVTFRAHEANKKLRENYGRQQAMIRAQNRRQLMDEKAAINARINRLTPAARHAFLKMRLAAVEEQLWKTGDQDPNIVRTLTTLEDVDN